MIDKGAKSSPEVEVCHFSPEEQPDRVNHPQHYTDGPEHLLCGQPIECIDVVETMTFNRGNAIKYLWRAGKKDNEIEDLRKAAWYASREADRLERERLRNSS